MENFKPGAVACSVGLTFSRDRLGVFNLSLRGAFCDVAAASSVFLNLASSVALTLPFHPNCSLVVSFFMEMNIGHGDCVRFVKSFGLPTIVIGGGGYTIRNVASLLCLVMFSLTRQSDELPINRYFEYYGPDYRLHIQLSNMENFNSHQYLTKQETGSYEFLKVSPRLPCQFKRGSLERRKPRRFFPQRLRKKSIRTNVM